jgi:diadenylate cyclase
VPAASEDRDARRRSALAALAPGTALRDGLERILRGSTGALIVLGHDQVVAELCSGGFELNAEFSPTRLRELAKMDGAIVLDGDGRTITRAAVQLVPDPAIPADESGTRHRTAQRVSRQTGYPVVSVSKSMRVIALFIDGTRIVIEDSAAILSHAGQALETLTRYRRRLDEVSGALTALEIQDVATVADVSAVAQRLEMVRRIAGEIDGYMVQLGTDGRLLALHLDELVAGTGAERGLLARDYVRQPAADRRAAAAGALTRLERLSLDEILDTGAVASALGVGGAEALDAVVSPHGYRLLSAIPRVPGPVLDSLAEHFGGLQKLLAASLEDLRQVPGVDAGHARAVREGLARILESSIVVERYR